MQANVICRAIKKNCHCLLSCPNGLILIQHLYPILLAIKDEGEEFNRTIPYL